MIIPKKESAATDMQLRNIIAVFERALFDDRLNLNPDHVQNALCTRGLGPLLLEALQQQLRRLSSMRIVHVDVKPRSFASYETQNCVPWYDWERGLGDMLASPCDRVEKVPVYLFLPDELHLHDRKSEPTTEAIDRSFELRGLKPAHPLQLAALCKKPSVINRNMSVRTFVPIEESEDVVTIEAEQSRLKIFELRNANDTRVHFAGVRR